MKTYGNGRYKVWGIIDKEPYHKAGLNVVTPAHEFQMEGQDVLDMLLSVGTIAITDTGIKFTGYSTPAIMRRK